MPEIITPELKIGETIYLHELNKYGKPNLKWSGGGFLTEIKDNGLLIGSTFFSKDKYAFFKNNTRIIWQNQQ